MLTTTPTSTHTSLYASCLKPLFDRVVALMLLILLAPLLLVLAVAIRLALGAPVVFRQARPGYRGKVFTLYKFRSMTNDRGADGTLLSDAQRMTRFGSFLRSSSLDELPELLNVLKGEMSLVGPRPLYVEYLERYSPEQARRHDVTPGITGWAQVNGRNAISWDEKFTFDIWYVDHVSLALDVRILWRTIAKVLIREGISQAGEATMQPFLGSDSTASSTTTGVK